MYAIHIHISQKQLPRKMNTRLVIIECAGYNFRQLFLWRLYFAYPNKVLSQYSVYTMIIIIETILNLTLSLSILGSMICLFFTLLLLWNLYEKVKIRIRNIWISCIVNWALIKLAGYCCQKSWWQGIRILAQERRRWYITCSFLKSIHDNESGNYYQIRSLLIQP